MLHDASTISEYNAACEAQDTDEPEITEYFLETSHVATCGQITISLRNVSPWIYPVSYSTDGTSPSASGPNYGPVVDNRTNGGLGGPAKGVSGSKTLTFEEDENGGTVTVKYVVAAGSERDLYVGQPAGTDQTVEVDTDCVENILPVECVSFEHVRARNQNHNGWTLGSGVKFVSGGVNLAVDGNWEEISLTRTLSGDLRDLGDVIDFSPGTQYLGLHVGTSHGTLVYEKVASYDGKWWSTSDEFNAKSGMGYNTFDSLKDLVANNPDTKLTSLTILIHQPS